MILDQLAERERGRAASDEERRREGEEMKARIQALKEEEQRVGGRESMGRQGEIELGVLWQRSSTLLSPAPSLPPFTLTAPHTCSARRSARQRRQR